MKLTVQDQVLDQNQLNNEKTENKRKNELIHKNKYTQTARNTLNYCFQHFFYVL